MAEIITLGNNMQSPLVCLETAQACYAEIEKTKEFDIGKYNAILMTVVTYLDHHGIEYGDKALPWSESLKCD